MNLKSYEIEFKNISFFLHFGHLKEERKLGQRIFIDISIKLDTESYKSIKLIDSIYDYTRIEKCVNRLVTIKEYHLLENLSNAIASDLLNDQTINSVLITIRKPSVPVDLILDYASTTMEYTR